MSVIMLVSLPLHTASAAAVPSSLQAMVDQAATGSTVTVPAGDYTGPLVINKPLQLEAQGQVKLTGAEGDKPILEIAADGVQLSGFELEDTRQIKTTATILVRSSNNSISDVTIRTRSSGIFLREANHNTLKRITVDWLPTGNSKTDESFARKGNGIDLLKSNDNTITDSKVSGMFDGIYLESSKTGKVMNNRVDHSRYGIHLMFTNDIEVSGNRGFFNVTGGMMMSSEDIVVSSNEFMKQNENVNSQGLLIFDVKRAEIRNNRMEGNRIGMYVEQADSVRFIDNLLLSNFVGLDLVLSENNDFRGNHFFANVTPAQAMVSKNNRVAENYWDNFNGIDFTGQGTSDLPYRVNPFFQTLSSENSVYQLFFQAPGMLFLEGLFQNGSEQWFTDARPLMKPQGILYEEGPKAEKGMTLAAAILLLLASLHVIYHWGVKRS
jgi:nitrous oxidase accessory protein